MIRWLLLVFLLAGCRRSEQPPPRVQSEELAGQRVYFSGAARDDEGRMPGVGFGTDRGPDLVLLSGAFAPLLIPDESGRTFPVKRTDTTVELEGAFSAEVRKNGFLVRGSVNVVALASRTKVNGYRAGRPVFSEVVSAGQDEAMVTRLVDRLELTNPKMGGITIQTDCAPRIIRPLSRGSTASFVVRLGPPRSTLDPLYAPEGAKDEAPDCVGTATITLTPPSP